MQGWLLGLLLLLVRRGMGGCCADGGRCSGGCWCDSTSSGGCYMTVVATALVVGVCCKGAMGARVP